MTEEEKEEAMTLASSFNNSISQFYLDNPVVVNEDWRPSYEFYFNDNLYRYEKDKKILSIAYFFLHKFSLFQNLGTGQSGYDYSQGVATSRSDSNISISYSVPENEKLSNSFLENDLRQTYWGQQLLAMKSKDRNRVMYYV